ncbi:MAG: hypothetical protein CMM01_04355 [Rhodopirellula sp.]|nr:hypothetical protein [Rhodopirellula sp.]
MLPCAKVDHVLQAVCSVPLPRGGARSFKSMAAWIGSDMRISKVHDTVQSPHWLAGRLIVRTTCELEK